MGQSVLRAFGNGVTQVGVDAVWERAPRECHGRNNRRYPSKDTLTPDGVGPRTTRHTLFDGVIVRARCAPFKRGFGWRPHHIC